ncbi:dihydroxyacid dehydratase [Jatrophihabitans endophyticus]|uniref:Dihydroxyacid dehydratase n=1 Tax=Jatrophihabitans endophyticus TaxID=1206085 RepID=A0A1M5CJD5_9ACTN|nr:IlvD/Edd family dehydratase [Jatrophihabitans endophyticus]SHF54829.1 dihydroxyacid dehydratase [Jatrophihabitans endophyticus]
MSLRSAAWFAAEGKTGIMHRSWLRSEGLPDDSFEGRPVIGIANSWSELTPCNVHLRELAEHVKRGVWQAGGVPFEFPTTSAGEPLVRPSAMLLRNLISMDLEETLRANPLDGVVLLAGCDKTTPAYLMGAASVDLPTVLLTGGPMLNGKYRGTDIGSGTSVWRLTEQYRAGEIGAAELAEAEGCMARSRGHCMTMGTASTMAVLGEVLGMQLPGGADLPADDARRRTLAHLAGRRIVAMVAEQLTMSRVVTRASFENAIRVNAALGGSTNAVVHLLAIAGRLGVSLTLDDFDALAADLPTLVDLMPSGRFLMEDFCYAGGAGALVAELGERLDRAARTVTGRTLGENYAAAQCHDREVIRTFDDPVKPPGSHIAVLRGSLAPAGAVIKQSAAAPELMRHRGRARVWDRVEDYLAEADRPDCDIAADDVIVVRNAGPRGYPGMPEIGNVALPKRLLEQGVRDMVRISDARMSGTSYGTVVLHVAPEAAAGGPLALVRDGDVVVLDVPARRLDLEVDDAELARRRAEWRAEPAPGTDRGYLRLFVEHVTGAEVGADFDFLRGRSGADVPRQAF